MNTIYNTEIYTIQYTNFTCVILLKLKLATSE